MKPIVATVIGDPCGVGPEVVLKSLADATLGDDARPLLIGSLAALEKTRAACGIDIALRAVGDVAGARFERGIIDVLDDPPHWGSHEWGIGRRTRVDAPVHPVST